jgi:hypothetical protein
MNIGLITGLVIFVQTVGDIFGFAIYAAVYQNVLRTKLHHLSLTVEDIGVILADVQKVKAQFKSELYQSIIEVYAESLHNDWWWLLTAGLLISSACTRQRKL